MRIGIIAAMRHEMDLIEQEMLNVTKEHYASFVFICGKISSNEIILVESGVGKVNASVATTLLVTRYDCKFIINTGIAGGISPLQTKDVIIANKLIYSDVDATIFGYSYGQVPSMPKYYAPGEGRLVLVKKALNNLGISYKEAIIYTGDSFITSKEQLKNVDSNFNAATEMEGTAVAQAATRLGADFMIIRYISDIIGMEQQVSDYNSFENEMAERSSKVMIELLKQIEVGND